MEIVCELVVRMLASGKMVSGPKDIERLTASPTALGERVIGGRNCSDDGMKKNNGRSDGEASDERCKKGDGVNEEGRTGGTSLKRLKGSSVLTTKPLAVIGLRVGNRSDRVAVDKSTYVSSGPVPKQGNVL